jgi:amino acid permease
MFGLSAWQFAGIGFLCLILIYIIIRLFSSALFRSYFEAKQKYEKSKKGENHHDEVRP